MHSGGSLSPAGSLLLTVLRRLFWCDAYLMLFGVGVSCSILYSIVMYFYVCSGGSVSSVAEERANLSAIVNL